MRTKVIEVIETKVVRWGNGGCAPARKKYIGKKVRVVVLR